MTGRTGQQLTDHQLADLLKRGVPEPDPTVDRAGLARGRAGAIRRRRWVSAASAAALAVVAAVALPTVLGDGQGNGVVPGPAGASGSTSPSGQASPSECDPDCRPATVLAAIKRPLRLPMLAPGASCRVSPVRRFPAGAGFNTPFDAISSGTVAMVGFAGPDGALVQDGDRAPGGWHDQKVIWVFEPSYSGPVLLRGQRIDAPGRLGFAHYLGAQGYVGGAGDEVPHEQLFYLRSGLTNAGGTLESYPSGVYVREPGCYAVQVDGLGFSERLVFQVVAPR
jgi:hypothetical protein